MDFPSLIFLCGKVLFRHSYTDILMYKNRCTTTNEYNCFTKTTKHIHKKRLYLKNLLRLAIMFSFNTTIDHHIIITTKAHYSF